MTKRISKAKLLAHLRALVNDRARAVEPTDTNEMLDFLALVTEGVARGLETLCG